MTSSGSNSASCAQPPSSWTSSGLRAEKVAVTRAMGMLVPGLSVSHEPGRVGELRLAWAARLQPPAWLKGLPAKQQPPEDLQEA